MACLALLRGSRTRKASRMPKAQARKETREIKKSHPLPEFLEAPASAEGLRDAMIIPCVYQHSMAARVLVSLRNC